MVAVLVGSCVGVSVASSPPHAAKINKKSIVYFETPGIQNTEHVVDAITYRLNEDDIEAIVVASCSGSSALLLANAIKGLSMKIINISVPKEAVIKREMLLDIGDTFNDSLRILSERILSEICHNVEI